MTNKYLDRIKVGYGAMFFTDNKDLCYNLKEAVAMASSEFYIINPLAPGKIDGFSGKIWRTYEEFPQLASVRTVRISDEENPRILDEEFSLIVNGHSLYIYYDYEFLFNDKLPNLVGEKIMDDGEEKTLTIRPLVLPYRTYASPVEYLDSEFEDRRDIELSYAFEEETWWKKCDSKTLLRRVNNYRRKHDLPKLELTNRGFEI